MDINPDVERELELNRQRTRQIEGDDLEGAPVDEIDHAYQSFVDPPLLEDEPDDAESRRTAIDQETRGA